MTVSVHLISQAHFPLSKFIFSSQKNISLILQIFRYPDTVLRSHHCQILMDLNSQQEREGPNDSIQKLLTSRLWNPQSEHHI